ncbi:sialic acid-binding Ig-like lectin 6 [Centroberyx affinis]|uniref:sialic acid-binding Ig-like lectin 6 n=1 Tax=Centroberyx affinis TaxID=166261 RepID=UPI003A5C7263
MSTLVQSQDDWGVTYTSTEICALKGSTVDIHCTYRYPAYLDHLTVTAEKTLWFTKQEGDQPVDLRTDSEYEGRVEYHGHQKNCILRITDLRETDSAVYKFRFITNHPTGKYTASSGVTLTVTDLRVQVSRPSVYQFSTWAELQCHSSCRLASCPSYVWYRSGEKIKEGISYTGYFGPEDNYSCAVKGQEDFQSPSVYAPKVPSALVSPSGEIVEGSSVTLTCSSDANPAATYTWYKENGNPDHKPLKTGPQLDFVSIQSSDSGEYYCSAENALRSKRSDSMSINVKWKGTIYMNAARLTLIILILITVFLLYLWIRKKKTLNSTTEPSDPVQTVQSDSDPEYENLTAAQTEATEEQEDLV